mmetsp:Transcript_8314/g.13894  ORF Transcript_8314/g.13894 Transcript_8314/m.13894 type:complete len:175 (-) Transcript_8314:1341-1865(-)
MIESVAGCFFTLIVNFIIFSLVGMRLGGSNQGSIMGQEEESYDKIHMPNQCHLSHFLVYATVAQMQSLAILLSSFERMKLSSIMAYDILMQGSVFPLVLAWTLGHGWLEEFGFMDNGGSTYIFLVSGASALVASIVIGPRKGVFDTQLDFEKKAKAKQVQLKKRRVLKTTPRYC